jgi:hypothetical protein
MKPGDMILWRDAKFGVNRVWRIESVLLGALEHESLIRLTPMFEKPGSDEHGNRQETVLVPEVLLRGLEVIDADTFAAPSGKPN